MQRMSKMKNMRTALLFLLVAMISLSVSAQNVTVKGTVKDKTGETVIGASVVQKGNTGNGTITDIDGNFTLSVPANSTLVISYVGMKTQEIALKGQTKINVVLDDDSQALDEVVVIGYGTVQKKDLTGSVASVSAKQLSAVPVSNASEAYRVRWPVYKLLKRKVLRMRISVFVYAAAVLCRKTTPPYIS